jgi:hypothetical protein
VRKILDGVKTLRPCGCKHKLVPLARARVRSRNLHSPNKTRVNLNLHTISSGSDVFYLRAYSSRCHMGKCLHGELPYHWEGACLIRSSASGILKGGLFVFVLTVKNVKGCNKFTPGECSLHNHDNNDGVCFQTFVLPQGIV